MATKKKSASHTPGEILKAQREFARFVKNKFNPYKENQIQMLASNNNKPTDAAEQLAHKLFNGFTKLHYLFLFSLNSDDATVFSQYSSAFTSLSAEFLMVERSCQKTNVNFVDICSLVMRWTPPYVFNGREKEGIYPWEEGLSELALELRRRYANELTDKEHIKVMKEHFNQYGIKY